MSNYQYGTEESYKLLCEAGMPKHPRMRYTGGGATMKSATLLSASSGTGIAGHKIHPKDARDALSMHALRWVVALQDDDGIQVLEDLRIFDEPIDAFDGDPALEANLNIEGSQTLRGKADMLDTIVEVARVFMEHKASHNA